MSGKVHCCIEMLKNMVNIGDKYTVYILMYLIGMPVEPELLEEFKFCSYNKTSFSVIDCIKNDVFTPYIRCEGVQLKSLLGLGMVSAKHISYEGNRKLKAGCNAFQCRL